MTVCGEKSRKRCKLSSLSLVACRFFQLIRFIFLLSDLNICSDGDNKFTTPLQMAARFNSPNTAHLLILNGANVAKQSNYGQQALHYAARRGNLKVLQVGPYLEFFLSFFEFFLCPHSQTKTTYNVRYLQTLITMQ